MQNLRPVSLMCTMKKLATRIMADRLQKAAENRGTYTDRQFGFRAGHGTKQAIARLHAAISGAWSSKRAIAVAYLEFGNMYCTISHELVARVLKLLRVS